MKQKFYSMYGTATDSNGEKHVVTVVGKFEQYRERKMVEEEVDVALKPNSRVVGRLKYPSNKILTRKLTLGMSICHPNDEFDKEVGIELAKKRIANGEILGALETNDVTMLTQDAVMGELFVKLQHITKNIDKYIGDN